MVWREETRGRREVWALTSDLSMVRRIPKLEKRQKRHSHCFIKHETCAVSLDNQFWPRTNVQNCTLNIYFNIIDRKPLYCEESLWMLSTRPLPPTYKSYRQTCLDTKYVILGNSTFYGSFTGYFPQNTVMWNGLDTSNLITISRSYKKVTWKTEISCLSVELLKA